MLLQFLCDQIAKCGDGFNSLLGTHHKERKGREQDKNLNAFQFDCSSLSRLLKLPWYNKYILLDIIGELRN